VVVQQVTEVDQHCNMTIYLFIYLESVYC